MAIKILPGFLLCLLPNLVWAQSLLNEQTLSDSIEFYKAKKQHSKSIFFCLQLRKVVEAGKGNQHTDYGNTVSLLGENYRRLSKLDSSEFWLKKGLSILENNLGKENEEVATRLNNLGLLYLTKSDLNQADSCIRTALNVRQKRLGEDNPFTATSFHNLGQVKMAKGELDSSEIFYTRALAIRRRVLGENHEDVAASLNNLANVKRHTGSFDAATTLLNAALEIRKKLLGTENEEVGYAYLGLGNVYFESGDYDQTEEFYNKAITICSKALGENHKELADIYLNMAGLQYRRGHFFKAEEMYQKALTIKQKEEHPEVETIVALYTNMGNLANDLGNFQKGIRYNLAALEAGERVLGITHPTICTVYSNLAIGYSNVGQKRMAISFHQKSIDGNIKTLGPDYHELGASYLNLGSCYQDLGQINKALQFTKKSLAVWTKAFGPVHPKLADAYTNLGYLHEVMEQEKVAEKYYQKSIALQLQTLGSRHPDVGMNYLNLGILNMKNGLYPKAEPYFLKNIQNWNNQIRQYFPGLSANEKEQLYNQLTFHFQNFGAFALKRATSNPAILGTLFNQQLSVKGLLLSSSKKFKFRLENSKDSALRASFKKWESLTTDISDYYTSSDSADRVELNNMILEAEKLEKELARKSAEFAELKKQKPVVWTDIRDKLKPGEAAIEMIRLQKFGLNRQFIDSSNKALPIFKTSGLTDTIWYAALIVKPGCKNPELVLLKNGNLLENKWIKVYRNHIRAQQTDENSYNEFWKKIDTRLGPEIKRVYFSPDGVYNYINLNTIQHPKTGKYLLETRDIHLLTNTRDLLTASLTSKPTNLAFLIGFPQFNSYNEGPLEAIKLKNPYPETTYELPASRGEIFAELPGTKIEVENIGGLLGKMGWRVSQLTGDQALEERVKEVKNPQLLHIATHGFFKANTSQGTNPLVNSGLLLAGANLTFSGKKDESREDGILTAYEAMNLNLDNTDLVVLSACETGLGEIKNGEGVYGLQRAFKVAGAKSIIMSLWKVDDEATQELMVGFYRNWLGGKTKRTAFLAAQKELMAKYPNPYYWGAFVMVGE